MRATAWIDKGPITTFAQWGTISDANAAQGITTAILAGVMHQHHRAIGSLGDVRPSLGDPFDCRIVILIDAMARNKRVYNHHVYLVAVNGLDQLLDQWLRQFDPVRSILFRSDHQGHVMPAVKKKPILDICRR